MFEDCEDEIEVVYGLVFLEMVGFEQIGIYFVDPICYFFDDGLLATSKIVASKHIIIDRFHSLMQILQILANILLIDGFRIHRIELYKRLILILLLFLVHILRSVLLTSLLNLYIGIIVL